MNSHLALKIPGFCVACMDAGEGREQGCGSFANLRNSLLLPAIRRLKSGHFEYNLLRPESIRGSLSYPLLILYSAISPNRFGNILIKKLL